MQLLCHAWVNALHIIEVHREKRHYAFITVVKIRVAAPLAIAHGSG